MRYEFQIPNFWNREIASTFGKCEVKFFDDQECYLGVGSFPSEKIKSLLPCL